MSPAQAKRNPQARRRPVDATEGPWLIRSHYWKCWHRRSSDGGACGYTDDIAQAGVFEFAKAAEYHDWQRPGGRDEAVPVKRVARELSARLIKMEREALRLAERIEFLRGLANADTTERLLSPRDALTPPTVIAGGGEDGPSRASLPSSQSGSDPMGGASLERGEP